MRIAVIGSGISGSLAARLLSDDHDIHVFEANSYVGGHTHTSDVSAFGRTLTVDTGFMVFNERTYPHFVHLLRLLGVRAQDTDMSFSVHCDASGLEYQGSTLNGLFAQRRHLASPRFQRLLFDIVRFNRRATGALARDELDDAQPVADFLRRVRTGDLFLSHYLLPMTGAIWSTRPERMLEFPAKFLIGFLHNHGLLQIFGRPQWKTVVGGARAYMNALTEPFRSRIRLNCRVTSVRRFAEGVGITTVSEDRPETFDAVVFASHADQTLEMLADASPQEHEALSAFPYQVNDAVLHTDRGRMPQRRRAWASWNYRIPARHDDAVTVTYDLNRLQNLGAPAPLMLTLNDGGHVSEQHIIRRFTYAHPAYEARSVGAQQRIAALNGVNRTYFCGAYCGYGFHEDGVNSALAVAKCFGKSLETCTAASTKDESLTSASAP
jgi:predicted NAD/FAD-binding protein